MEINCVHHNLLSLLFRLFCEVLDIGLNLIAPDILVFVVGGHPEPTHLTVLVPSSVGVHEAERNVIVNVGGKLLFVECKTQIADNTDIDKFRTAVRNYSGMGGKALFVTYSPMRPEAVQKCKDSGILTFSFQKDSYLMRPESELLNMLDKEITNINKK